MPETVVKQLQLNSRAAGVGRAVGIATGVASGVATAPGTLTSGDGAPGNVGTEGRVWGGGPGGGAGACARATAARAMRASAVAITARAAAQRPEIKVGKILIAKRLSS